MPSGRKVRAFMDDGTEYVTWISQRDVAKWEMQDFYTENGATLATRYQTWSSLHRTGQVKIAWTTFDKDFDYVRFEDDEEVVADPTQKDQPQEG